MAKPSITVRAFRDQMNTRMLKVAKIAITDLTDGIIEDTPVATGRLMGGHRAGTNKSPAPELERGLDPNGEGARTEVKKVLAGLRLGDIFQFKNEVPYAIFQELGTSQIEAKAFFGRNLARWKQYVENAVRKSSL